MELAERMGLDVQFRLRRSSELVLVIDPCRADSILWFTPESVSQMFDLAICSLMLGLRLHAWARLPNPIRLGSHANARARIGMQTLRHQQLGASSTLFA